MKKLMMAAVVAAACALTGCITPPQNNLEAGAPADTRVTVAPDIGGDVVVTDVRCAKISGSSSLTFQANMVNNTGSQLVLEWRVQWLDKDGFEIDSVVSTWNARALQPYEICALKGVAPNSSAADMRFYVRKGR